MVARHEQALLVMAQQSAACNASHPVEARLSRWMLRARDLCGGETLPLTKDSLAQLIGMQRNAISIVAHALQRAGIIRYSRGYLDITNAGSLRETACECSVAVKAHHQCLLKISY
ncbi:MAG: Crp/Fnr family transcriptional regulator [Vulcanimicrobiaceae bacterium]